MSVGFGTAGVISLISGVLTARLYGIHVIGEYAVAYAPTGAVWYLSTIREQPAMIRLLAVLPPRDPRVTGIVAAVFAFSQALTVIMSLIVAGATYVLFRGPIAHPGLYTPAMVMLASYALLANPGWNIDTVFASFRAGREALGVRVHQALAYVIAVVPLWLVLPTIWGMTLALVISYGSSTLHRVLAVRRYLRFRVKREELVAGFRELPGILKFGLRLTPGLMAMGVSAQAGTWVLSAVAPVGVVGAWNRAAMVSTRLGDINSRIGGILFPTLVERRHRGDVSGFDRALIDSMRYLLSAMLLPAAAAGGAASGVLDVFGPGFSKAATALAIMLVVAPALGILSFQAQVFLAFDRPLTTTWFEVLRMAVTGLLTATLAHPFGVTGAACGVGAGCVAQLALQTHAVRAHLSSPVRRYWPYRSMAALAGAYAGGFAASDVTLNLVGGWPGLAIALPCGSFVYLVLLYVMGGIQPRDAARFGEVSRGIRARRGKKVRPIGVERS